MSDSHKKKWPGETEEAYPEVFNKIPPQPNERKPGQLTQEQVEDFFDKGFVIVENFFNKEDELEPIKKEIEEEVEKVAHKLYNAGKIKNLYNEYGLFKRLTMIEKEFPGANLNMISNIAKVPKTIKSLWTTERLLNVAEQILGTADIAGNPVWNLRTKTPQNEATVVPWHQDVGYTDNDSYKVMVVSAWIPLLDATVENGCLQFISGGHKSGKVATHQCCWGGTHYVMLEENEMEKTLGVDIKKDVVTCEVPYGGILLFNNIIPHRSLPNMSNDIRWSMDLRWQRADQPAGFYGVKKCIQFRSSTDKDFKINWDPFDGVDRHKKSFDAIGSKSSDFDIILKGPWMEKWEITHENKHTKGS